MAVRKARIVKDKKDIEYVSSIKEEDVTLSFIMELFGEFNGKTRFNPYDEIEIPAGSYGIEKYKNKESFYTTVGLYVFNKFFIEKDLIHVFGYINQNVDDKMFSNMNSTLSTALLEDDITVAVMKRYLMKTQKVMPYVSILAPNYTEKMLTCSKVIDKKKKELYTKYKEGIDAGDPATATKMEKELLAYALEYMKDDPSMDMFISGARGSVGNNFKNMFVVKGAIKDPDPNAKQKYKVAMSNYIDGIAPEEYSLFANSLAAGPFARAKKTEVGGALEKLFLYGMQHVKMDEPGSDCKTKKTKSVKLTEKNIKKWMYSYIMEGETPVELTSKNKGKYIGKTVKIRFSSLCQDKKPGCTCNICGGNLPYRRGIQNSGIETTQIASTMKNKSMKSFHDSVQQMHVMDVRRAFEPD